MIRISKTTSEFIVLCIAITYLLTGNMLAIFSTGFPYRDYLRVFIALWGGIVAFETINVRRIAIDNILSTLFFFLLLAIPTTLTFYLERYEIKWAVFQVFDALVWVGVFTITYRVGLREPDMINRVSSIVACSIVIYSALFTQVKIFSAGRGIPLVSTAYYALFFLPFALLSKNKIIKWGGIVLVLYTLLLCMKRTGFIAFIAGIVVYYLIEFKSAPKGSWKRLICCSLADWLAFVAIYFVHYAEYKGNISVLLTGYCRRGRPANEGREDVWIATLNMIKHSNIIEWIFGHGFDTVIEDSPLAAECALRLP